MEFEQQSGGEATGDASCHEQIADPGEQRRRIGGGCQALFEGLQLLHVAAAPQGIDQGVFSRPRLGELSAGHRRWGSIPSVMAPAQCPCHPSLQRSQAQKKLRWFHQSSKHSLHYFS